jgi:hypothetical protein
MRTRKMRPTRAASKFGYHGGVRLRFVLGVAIVGGVALAACGGGQFTLASDAGSSSGTDTDSGGSSGGDSDSAAACVTEPTSTGGEQQFCDDEQHIFVKCGNCEACRQADLNDCRTLGDVLSDGYKAAIHACRDSNICGDYTTYSNAPCVRQQFAGTKPTSAQQDAKTAYCTGCPQNPQECTHFFDLGGDAGAGDTAGIGAYVLVASDPIVNTMISGCSGPTYCSPAAYQACTGLKLCAATPADKCKSGFCFK